MADYYNETDKNQDDNQVKKCDENHEKTCPVVKLKPNIEIPDISNEEFDAYKKISKTKKQKIDDDKKTAYRSAKKARDDSMLDIKFALETAKSAFDIAKKKNDSENKKEETRVDFEIEKLFDEYKKNLLEASHGIPNLKNCESADDLPDYIKWVYIIEFHQKVAELTIGYQNKLKEIEKVLFEATKIWEQAQKDYSNAYCGAIALEHKAQRDADLAWRTSLKAEVDIACKV